jgi:hypothetical protein
MKDGIEKRNELAGQDRNPAQWPNSIGTFGGIEITELVILAYHDGVTPVWFDIGSKNPLKLVMRDYLRCCIVRASENQHAARKRESWRSQKVSVHWGE